ncbi:hypothetical protein RB215_03360 [Pseudoalteromonas sp. HL-AS2]|uniref:hypothetical protein n=1 Tax=Pseudoalteromonas sp. HL-AS2 TaxID=3071082 RepID=UPI002814E404|nr:hypothetical protein [Pseudoalteromonas sp. HL-AS2]WMS95113.1 hypothetical protein RB215_03360 [Pseudoalteromonas sp. HL-AS2]
MLNKSNLLGLCCFILGVGLTSGYFLFLHSMPIQAQQSQPFPYKSIVIKQANDESLNSTDEHVNPADGNSQAESIAPYTHKIATLTNELELKTKQLKRVEQALKLAQLDQLDFAKQLEEKFIAEDENSQWSYEVETALTDFLITSDLSNTAQLTSLECKQTLCKFSLVADKTNQQEHVQWRELNDKLALMPWWQQFKLTSSNSTDEQIDFIVSTKE